METHDPKSDVCPEVSPLFNNHSPARTNLRGLWALNIALLAVLAAVTLGGSLQARAQAQARGRGDYTMVAGGVNGSEVAAVYIADVANQEIIAMVYNQQTKVLDGLGYRNLAADAASVQRGRTRPNQ